uniref:Vesicular acetylcholine transporter n=1 Tax=Ditylenchus dipsaci TaxID=166011 RepID=A0A915ECS0_9BILA
MRYVTDGASNMKAAIWDPFLNRNVDPVEQEMEFLLVDQAEYVTLDTPYNYEATIMSKKMNKWSLRSLIFHSIQEYLPLSGSLPNLMKQQNHWPKEQDTSYCSSKYSLVFSANNVFQTAAYLDDLNLVCLSQKWPTIEPSDAFLLKHVCRIIEPFREVTDSLQQDKNPSISRLLPGILCLSKFLQDQTTLRSICTKLRARLEIRFDHVLSSGMPGSDPIYVAASFFDPSVSCLDVLLGWEKKAKNAIKFIVEKFADDEDSQVEHVWVDEAVSEPIRKNLFSFYGTNLRPTIHLQSEISNLSEEIDAFLANLWNSGIPEEATLFWERNKSVYKQISPVALSVLASPVHSGGSFDYLDEEIELGWLFASKALLQIFVNPFSGFIIDRVGYELPMIIGLIVMFSSTAIFALGKSYGVLFFARSLQGFGSAFADTSGLAMIADRFTEENERSAALVLYSIAGKPVPFLILSFVCLIDAFMVFMVIQPKARKSPEIKQGEVVNGTPMWQLFMDPFIAVCSGALIMANVSLAFLEPTITNWIDSTMKDTPNWLVGMIWFPAFFPHVIGVYVTVKLLRKYPQHPWVLAVIGLAMEGISCAFVPFTTSVGQLIVPLSTICFGIALIDTSLLPMLGYLVDTRHVSVYGSVYAIADISYSLAYAFGPIIAGGIVGSFGFIALNILICVLNLAYTPVLLMLRNVYVYKSIDGKPAEQSSLQPNGKPNENHPMSVLNSNNSGWGEGGGADGYGSMAAGGQESSLHGQPGGYQQQGGDVPATAVGKPAFDPSILNGKLPEEQKEFVVICVSGLRHSCQ